MSTKINILSSLSKKADNLVIVGAMANNFLKFKGINVGKSLIEEGSENIVKNMDMILKELPSQLLVIDTQPGKGLIYGLIKNG